MSVAGKPTKDVGPERSGTVITFDTPELRAALDPLRWFWCIFEALPCARGLRKGADCADLGLGSKCAVCEIRFAMRKLREESAK